MVSIKTGIYNEFMPEFQEFCKENDMQITYASCEGRCYHINVTVDVFNADKLTQFKERTDKEHRSKQNFLQRFFEELF